MYLLNVLTGDDSQQERRIHDLRSLLSAKGSVSIGRDPTTADIAMDSKDLPAMISRDHAEISYESGQICLRDRKSVNGTWYGAAF
jgi:pSer/pThr/pTyr-binding forkhead associated (FHA) protein